MIRLAKAHCLLAPLRPEHRSIDVPEPWWRVVRGVVMDLVTFPTSIPDRIRQCWSARRIPQAEDVLVPDRYGAGRSLRDVAADEKYRTYFQYTDALRYGEIVDRVLLRAVGAYLEDLGYSAVDFQEAFTQTINDLRGATVSNSAFGAHATVVNGPVPDTETKGKR